MILRVFLALFLSICGLSSSAGALDLTTITAPAPVYDGANRLVFMASQRVYNGTLVNKPTCASGGTPRIYIMPMQWKTRPLDNQWYTFEAVNVNANLWRAHLILYDSRWLNTQGAQTVYTGFAYMGIAMVYCAY